MNKIKTIIAFIASMALVATAAIAGTLAYQTSSSGDLNTMTVGQVDIKQNEQERVDTTKFGTLTEDDMQGFVQDKPLLPYVGDFTYEKAVLADYRTVKLLPNENAIDKFVSVTNTGDHPAYVRTVFAFEKPSDLIEKNILEDDIWVWEWISETVIIDGTEYSLGVATYVLEDGVLEPDETTPVSLMQVALHKTADNSDVAKYGDTYDILVVSQAVQTKGFNNGAESALNEAFGEISATNHPWIATEVPEMDGDTLTLTENLFLVDKNLYHDYTASTPKTIDGKGHTVIMAISDEDNFGKWEANRESKPNPRAIPKMSNMFSSSNASLITIKDITITGTTRGNLLGDYEGPNYGKPYKFNTQLDNVNFVNLETVAFTEQIASGVSVYGTVTMNNCRVYGTTFSEMNTVDVPLYDLAVTNGSKVTVNGGKLGSVYLWNQAKVELYDVQVDSIDTAAISTNKLGSLIIGKGTTVDKIKVAQTHKSCPPILTVKSGAIVETLDLSDVKLKSTISIEEGATVKNIVADGVTYTSISEWKNA